MPVSEFWQGAALAALIGWTVGVAVVLWLHDYVRRRK